MKTSDIISCQMYIILKIHCIVCPSLNWDGRRDRDRMVVGLTTTYAISAYHHKSREFEHG
jgi:hypothetical protein